MMPMLPRSGSRLPVFRLATWLRLLAGTFLSFAPTCLAAPDPATLIGMDIGSPALPGSTTVQNRSIRITAAGAGIGFRSDQFHFAAIGHVEDFDLRIRVADLRNTDLWAKAGLMFRSGTEPGAPFAAVFTTPSGAGCFLQVRSTAGGSSTNLGTFPANQPLTWLRLRRSGNSFTGFAGIDGTHWTQLGSRSLTAPGESGQLGLAVTSHQAATPTVAEFTDLSDTDSPNLDPVPFATEPPGPSSRRTSLVISEIMYHPADRTDGRQLEFVELYNSQPYFEDLTGWRIAGDIEFAFPPGTRIPGGGFLVIAASPSDVQSIYQLPAPTVLGPYQGRLANQGGSLRLLGERDAVLLEVDFSDLPPWPALADGSGHSLVLARPSLGESNPRAWAASRLVGGSPGSIDALEISALSGLRLNECQLPDNNGRGFVELFNAGPVEADLTGVRIGPEPDSLPFTIPAGTRIAPGGFLAFTWSQLGFSPKSSGVTLHLAAPGNTRFLDAVTFAPQVPGTSAGRWPNGGEDVRILATPSPSQPNPHPTPSIVINEAHPSPTSGNPDDEFVELFNAGSTDVDLGGWRFTAGIEFTFPTGSRLSPGGYLVVARNTTRLRELHPSLDASRVVGDFQGRLAARGERLVLSRPVTVREGNRNETVLAPVADAVLAAGGRWSPWADAGGSTLELIHPHANPTLESSWAASEESSRSQWVTVETRGLLDHGAGGTRPDSLHIYLMGEGECLVDDVEVIGPGNTNRLPNGTFETGLNGWTVSGNHIRSSLASAETTGASAALHLRASGNGDTGANRIFARLPAPLAAGNTVTLRARVKWLRGWPEILLRLHGNYLEAYGRLNAPAGPGTPGAPNSRLLPNAGPGFTEVTHFPAVPATAQPVTVTARVEDPDGIDSVTLRYRTDPGTTFTEIPMRDDGTGGDRVPGDNTFSALLPAPGAARLLAFTLVARDRSPTGATNEFPPTPSTGSRRECLVRFGDPLPSGAFGTYRLWVTQTNSDLWRARPNLSNEPVESTFIYGNSRVVYNAGARFAGSPFHQQFSSGPASDAHFVVDLPRTERILGTASFNKIHAPGNSPFDDNTLQREQAVYWLARKSGLPWLHRRFVHLVVNGTRKRSLMEDTQVGSDDVAEEFWPKDPDGNLFKLQPWFEFPDAVSQNLAMQNATFLGFGKYTTTGGAFKTARYRCNWLVRGADGTANEFTNVFQLAVAATDTANPKFESNLESIVDVDAWFRAFAVNHAVGNWDSVGYRNGQNTYAYKPRGGRWELFLWDANIVLGNGSDGPSSLPLFTCSDPVLARWFSTGTFRRRFRSVYFELANGPMLAPAIGAVLDAKYAAFQEHGVSATSPTTLKTFIASARNSILTQLARDTAPFSVTEITAGPGPSGNGTAFTINGTGPLDMTGLTVDGVTLPITWITTRNWSAVFAPPLPPASVTLTALDRFGRPLDGASQVVRPVPPAALTLRFNDAEGLLEYPALHNGIFRLESTPSLPAGPWQTVETRTVQSPGPLIFRIPGRLGAQRYFRIVEP